MFPGLTLAYWLTLHGLVTLTAVMVYVLTAHLLQQRRHPAAAIAWVLFILLVPYVALPTFLTFGSRKQARPRATALPAIPGAGPTRHDRRGGSSNAAEPQLLESLPGRPTHTSWPIRTAQALGQPAPQDYRDLHIHANGHAALNALWRVIGGATQSIDLCSFIVGPDAIGREVVARLAAKARAGVAVRLMVDGLGSLMGGRPDFKPLTRAGAQVAVFVPPLHSPLKGRTNLRDHRKMLIADAHGATPHVWSGGRNLAVEYFEGDAKKSAWHDLSFDLGGAVVGQFAALFEHDWAFATTGRVQPIAVAAAHEASSTDAAQLIASGPDQIDDTVYSLLVTAAYRAQHRIAIVTPYFVPDAALLTALCLAARRGVRVELLLPARSNHRLSDVARSRALRALAMAGARIGLAPQMLHAKLVVVDEVLALAGSANIDSRSLFLNYELMLAFHDRDAIAGFDAWFEHERVGARPYAATAPGLLRDLAEGLVLWLGFQL
jgi:cardiolipin synthase